MDMTRRSMCTYVPKYYISTTFSLVSGRFLTMFALLQQASKGFILYMSPQIFSICPWGDSRKKIYLTYTQTVVYFWWNWYKNQVYIGKNKFCSYHLPKISTKSSATRIWELGKLRPKAEWLALAGCEINEINIPIYP